MAGVSHELVEWLGSKDLETAHAFLEFLWDKRRASKVRADVVDEPGPTPDPASDGE